MRKKFFTQRKLNIIFSALAIIVMWLSWIIAYYIAGNPLIVPSFSQTVSSIWHYLGDGQFWLAICHSFLRTLLAFLISFVCAVLCASLSALGKWSKAFLKPVIILIRTLPTMAVILLILKMTHGNRTLSPVIVTFLVLFPIIFSEIISAIEGIDGELIEMAEVYRIDKRDRLLKIYLPGAAPSILSQAGANISIGLKIMISAEVLANTANGLGGMMQYNNISAEIANLAALTLTAVFLGLLTELAFSQLKRITFGWSNKEDAK